MMVVVPCAAFVLLALVFGACGLPLHYKVRANRVLCQKARKSKHLPHGLPHLVRGAG